MLIVINSLSYIILFFSYLILNLYFNKNKISDIKVLETVKFDKLEYLDLENNKIDVNQMNLIILKSKSILKI